MLTAEEIWLVLTLHILGAIVWVGGTISLAVVVWAVRRSFPGDAETIYRVTSEVGRGFARVMWPALALAIVTGLVNLSWYVPPTPNWTGLPGPFWVNLSAGLVTLMAVTAGLHTFVVGPRIRRLRARATAPSQRSGWSGLNHALEGTTLVAALLVVGAMVVLGTI